MANKKTVLGPLTAYGEAVAGGYTRSREEFQAMLAHIPTYHTETQAAAEAAQEAADNASDAAARATGAETSVTEAAAAATEASLAAAQSASAAAASVTSAAQSATAAAASAEAAEQAVAQFETDTTLSEEGMAADAAATGDALSELKRDFAGVPLEVSGNPLAIADSAGAIPPRSMVLNLTPHQEGSGDPSPDNVRPITGYTGVEITKTGGNVIEWPTLSRTSNNGISYSISDGELTMQGTATGASSPYLSSLVTGGYETMPCGPFPAGQYTITADEMVGQNARDRIMFFARYEDNTVICENVRLSSAQNVIPNGTGVKYTFTASRSFKCGFFIEIIEGSTVNCKVKIRMNSGGSILPYEPYQEQTYPITIPSEAGTVYGGTLDMQTGVLSVTYGIADIGALNWSYDASLPRFYSSDINSLVKKPDTNDYAVNAKASMYAETSFNQLYLREKKNGTFAVSTSGAVSLIDTRYTSVASFKASMSGEPLVYPLATPLTYQLTPAQIELLKGSNTVWMDADGTIDLTYNGDIKTYIDSKVAELQALILENNG